MSRTADILDQLRAYESRNVTFVEPDGSWPIVWRRARGVHVWDAEGRRYLDLTAAFGVAAAGHANPRVVRAGQRQMATLLHAMGDVHPHELKARLARELSRVTFERWFGQNRKSEIGNRKRGKVIFCNSGFEAVEAALKTALLATGKPGVIAFEGGYHGLGYGALNATHREHFRGPFKSQLGEFGHFLPFPAVGQASSRSPSRRRTCDVPEVGDRLEARPTVKAVESALRVAFRRHEIGAILVEPVQVRGGINLPPPEFLSLLRQLCDAHGALLILDEIYTGFGRTGKWFACEQSGTGSLPVTGQCADRQEACVTIPDVICLGKALTGGFPLSACVGRADLMDAAWPASTGEAIHTSTFLGHPVGCAMALAQIAEIRRRKLVERSAELGEFLLAALAKLRSSDAELRVSARGVGLLAGLELRHADGAPATEIALAVIKRLLRRGFILLPEGEHANVISFTPPLTISRRQLAAAVHALAEEIRRR